jgi:hypothetical protein
VSAPSLVVVTQTAPRRYVAEVVGTPLWSAGPSPEWAVGSLVLQLGWRFGLATLVERTHATGFCAVPVVEVRRTVAPPVA